MNKELYHENRSKIVIAVTALIVLIAAYFAMQWFISSTTEKVDKEINAELDKLTYTEDSANKELEKLSRLMKKSPISDGVRGELYKSAAEISYMTGDEMLYNQYIAESLFYLKKVGNETDCVYLSNKYIGRLYSNGCYQSAAEVLSDISNNYTVSNLPLQMQASYFLSCADVNQMIGEDSSKFLSNAKAAIQLMEKGSNKNLSKAKMDLLVAREYISNNNFHSAEAIMRNYHEDDDFGLSKNQVYVKCDFTLPYYEIMTKIDLYNGLSSEAYDYVDKYITICDSYQFRTMKLNLLQYVAQHIESVNIEIQEKYRVMAESVAKTNLDKMTGEYGAFLLSDIDSKTKALQDKYEFKGKKKTYILLSFIALYILILLYCIGSIFMDYINKDGLTKLNNRKKYETTRIFCEKKKAPYCLLMLDIDNFKIVNDTYGHHRGDIVLSDIAAILRSYSGRGIYAYRYGGEELCMVLMHVPEKRTREIAEEIRAKVENHVSDGEVKVTVSIGVGVSVSGENVFQNADLKLYEAKENGKNQVR